MTNQRDPGSHYPKVGGSAPRASAAVSPSILGLGAVVVTVILGLLFFRLNGASPGVQPSQPAQSAESESSPGGTYSPTGSVPGSIGPEMSQPGPTVAPIASIPGDVPGPDATVPPGVPVISGLRIEALAGAWQAIGLACESWSSGIPGGGGGYTLHCERIEEGANVEFFGEAIYWTSDAVQWVSMSIDTINGQPIDGTAAATELFLPSAQLAGGEAMRGWVEGRIGDSSCLDECQEPIAGSQVSLSVGRLGGHQMYLVAIP